jgi:hypothetical protein
MRLLNIDLGKAFVVLHHVQCAVPKQRLQREHIAARAQIGERRRVPEPVRMAFLHAGFLDEKAR